MNLVKQWWSSVQSVIGAFLQPFGALWLLIKLTDSIFPTTSWADSLRSLWWVTLALGLTHAVIRAYPERSVKARIKDTDVVVEVRIGNIFKQKGAIVVGCNTTFDTSLEDGTISKTSIQGQFTEKYCSNVAELDQKLKCALEGLSCVKRSRHEKTYGKLYEYDFGTVAPINTERRRAYLVAITRLNEKKAATAELETLLDSLPKMWHEIRSHAGMEKLVCPILGSGYTRLNPTTSRARLVQEIIRSFVTASLEGKLSEKLSIVILGKDYRQNAKDGAPNDLYLEDLQRFLEHECRYARLGPSSLNSHFTGTPLQ